MEKIIKKHLAVLLIIFAIVLTSRLYFAFQEEAFSTDRAYFNIRQSEHISQTLMPDYDDELSYSGRTYIFTPGFQYLIALFSYVMPLHLVGKIIPNIFASLLVIIVFLITKEITQRNITAYLTAFISGFIPIYFGSTINNVSVYTLTIPLMFLAIYCIMKIGEKKYVKMFLILFLILLITHPSIILLIIGLGFYLAFVLAENFKQSKAETELILFSIFFSLWFLFLLFKEVFLFHGIGFLWQNMPSKILNMYFIDLNIYSLILLIGVLPFIFGLYIIYKYVFREKNRNIYILLGFALSSFLLLWLKLIAFTTGIIFLSIILTILFGKYMNRFLDYIERTKFAAYNKLILFVIFILFITTSVIPSFSYAQKEIDKAFSQEEIEALIWINENTPETAIVAASLEEGHIITAIAERKNVIDTNFLLIKNINERENDARKIFKTVSLTESLRILNKYEVNYVLFSQRAKKIYQVKCLIKEL